MYCLFIAYVYTLHSDWVRTVKMAYSADFVKTKILNELKADHVVSPLYLMIFMTLFIYDHTSDLNVFEIRWRILKLCTLTH